MDDRAKEENVITNNVPAHANNNPDHCPVGGEEEPVREISQTDHLNKKLLDSFLDRLNTSCPTPVDDEHQQLQDLEENDNDFDAVPQVTNGGKTTLVYKLKQKFPGCPVIHQDEFFLPPNHAGLHTDPELGHANWDELAALDMEKMMNVVQKSINDPGTNHSQDGNPPLIFVEGFLLYNYRPLAEVFDKKYFLTLPKEECFKRRCKRRYHPPDPPGYFEKICWPMYMKNKAELKDQEDIVYLDGMDNQWVHFDLVYEDIQELAKKIEVA